MVVMTMADLRMNPDELAAGAAVFAEHAAALNASRQTVSALVTDMQRAFAGFEATMTPILQTLNKINDGLDQSSQHASSLHTSVTGFASDGSDADRQNAQAISGA
jgi:uncharacterized protein YukE